MATEDVLKLLVALKGKATVNDIVALGKKRGLSDSVTHPVKVRDGLVRLMQMGAAKMDRKADWRDDEWTLIRQPTTEELASRKRRIL